MFCKLSIKRAALEKNLSIYFVDEVLSDELPQACVELLSMLVEHHGVGNRVQLPKA